MDKYKNYIARTEQDRIQLDILKTLEDINETLKTLCVKSVEEVVPEPVKQVESVKKQPTRSNKRGGK